MTRVLTVKDANGGDYGAALFEDGTTPEQRKECWEKAMANGGSMEHEMFLEGADATFTVRAYEFPDVPQGFMDLMRVLQDYDSSKYENWLLVGE